MRTRVVVDVEWQELTAHRGRTLLLREPVSTAKKGVGERIGSEQTPRGLHVVRAKIGAGVPTDGIFIARRFTGTIYRPELREQHPNRDFILTRILWLSGLEPGKNRLGDVDTFRRFIYIHGCPDDAPIGRPASHGCIRMRSKAVLKLFDAVDPGTRVEIVS